MFICFRHTSNNSKSSTPTNISLSYGSSPETCSVLCKCCVNKSASNASFRPTTPDDIRTKEDYDFYMMNNPVEELKERLNSLALESEERLNSLALENEERLNSLALENKILTDKLSEKENIPIIGEIIFLFSFSFYITTGN
jgi:hypothetical protein